MDENEQHHSEDETTSNFGEIISTMIDNVLNFCEADGWDAPARIFWVEEFHRDDKYYLAVRPGAILDGHPFQALVGMRAPEGVESAIIVVEGWMSTFDGRDSDNTEKTEVRIGQMFMPNGKQFSRFQRRGGSTDSHDGSTGRIPWAFRRYLRLPSTAPLQDIHSARQRALMSHLFDLADRSAISSLLEIAGGSIPLSDLDQPFRALAADDWEGVGRLLEGCGDDYWERLSTWADPELLSCELSDLVPSAEELTWRLLGLLNMADTEVVSAMRLALEQIMS